MNKVNNSLYNILLNLFLTVNIFSFFQRFIVINNLYFGDLKFIFKLNFLLGIVLLILKNKLNKKDFLIIFFGIILYFFLKDGNILMMIILSILLKNNNINKSIRYLVKVYIIIFIGIICSHLLGLTENIDLNTLRYQEDSGEFLKRYSLGFINPNTLYLNFLPIYSVYIFFFYEKWKLRNTFLMIISSGMIYFITKSRTVFLAILLTLFLINIKNFFIRKFFSNIFLYLTLFTLLCGKYLVTNNFLVRITSNRIELWSHFSNFDNIGLFSKEIKNYSEIVNYELSSHNLFLYILNRYGIVFYCIVMLIYFFIIKKSLHVKKDKWIIVIFLNLVVGIFEDGVLLFPINILSIYFYNFLLDDNIT